MTEDNRIPEIRAVLGSISGNTNDEKLTRIRAILDSAPPAPGPGCYPPADGWDGVAVGQEPLEPLVSTATTARRRNVHITQTPAPRVFFPGDTVPAGTAVMLDDGSIVEGAVTDERWDINDGPVVELLGIPTHEEWQAAVDQARAAREESPDGE